MGIINDLIYVKKHAESFEGPFLEVGSKDYGNTQLIRQLFPEAHNYVGADIEAGAGVDVVVDMSAALGDIDDKLGHVRFGTIFCLSVLEHCENPFLVAENLTSLLKPGGKILVSVPFSCGFHGYPSDYWRFTHEGIKKLFPRLMFADRTMTIATTRKNEFLPIDNNIGRISFSSRYYFRRGRYLHGISTKLVKFFSRIGVLNWLADYKYVMPPSFIYMIGELR